MNHVDVAVIGAGIVGLANAWSAARRGLSVALFEADSRAAGASIRNFGMLWPIGQASGGDHEIALASRQRWLDLADAAGIWINPCGSIHLAHRSDELAVLEEFADRSAALGYDCGLLTPEAVLEKSPAVNASGLLGGLWSGTEMCVNPREAIAVIPQWLSGTYAAQLHFDTLITHVETSQLAAADGREWQAERIVVCSGADFRTLFPECFTQAGLRRCKLQMLRTGPQPGGWRIGPHLASGLTLRHYANFAVCETLENLKRRIADETPELDRYGIHVMASQNNHGDVILGDSHEYDDPISPFNKSAIDELMLAELRKLIQLPDWNIAERWSGIYAKHPDKTWLEADPLPGVKVTTATGGAGMTMSFGLADELWDAWTQ